MSTSGSPRTLLLAPALAALVFCSVGAAGRQSPAASRSFFVAPDGKPSGSGTLESPWDLQTALNHPPSVLPGDTIWLRGGTYPGIHISYLNGTAASPILVRQYPNERAILDGGDSGGTAILTINGSYAWFWGFEVTSSDPRRQSTETGSWPSDIVRGDGIDSGSVPSPGIKLINLSIHDTRQGVSAFSTWYDTEIYGCLIYHNGWNGPDNGHGHGIYTQNQTGAKHILDSIIFENFGEGIQAYGSENAYLDNFDIEGVTAFENGDPSSTGATRNILVGGGRVATSPVLVANMMYYNATGRQPASASDLGYTAGCTGASFKDNYLANNAYFVNCPPTVMTGNSFFGTITGLDPKQYPDNLYASSRPAGVKVFVRPNRYEPERANVTIFNWDLQASVQVDLSGVLTPGTAFEVRNARDFYGAPVVAGTYRGGAISVPMASPPGAGPIGWAAQPPLGPEFGAFVVLPVTPNRQSPVPAGRAPQPRVDTRVLDRPHAPPK